MFLYESKVQEITLDFSDLDNQKRTFFLNEITGQVVGLGYAEVSATTAQDIFEGGEFLLSSVKNFGRFDFSQDFGDRFLFLVEGLFVLELRSEANQRLGISDDVEENDEEKSDLPDELR